jgi:hypothetical protein
MRGINWRVTASVSPEAHYAPAAGRLAAACFATFLASTTSAAGQAPPVACAAQNPRELHIHVRNDAGVSRESLTIAAAEARTIWQGAGLRLIWTFSPAPVDVSDPRTIYIILRKGPGNAHPGGSADVRSRADANLGWVNFDSSGRPGRVIQLSFDAIAQIARQGTILDRRVATMPDWMQAPALGRPIGRVIAHELGHWLGGRGHTGSGLMRTRFGPSELLDTTPPELPPEWIADATGILASRLASARTCPPRP